MRIEMKKIINFSLPMATIEQQQQKNKELLRWVTHFLEKEKSNERKKDIVKKRKKFTKKFIKKTGY